MLLMLMLQRPGLLLALCDCRRQSLLSQHCRCCTLRCCAPGDVCLMTWFNMMMSTGTSTAAAMAPAETSVAPAEAEARGAGGSKGLISKRMRRVLANRASAARSKDRKRAIEELETQASP